MFHIGFQYGKKINIGRHWCHIGCQYGDKIPYWVRRHVPHSTCIPYWKLFHIGVQYGSVSSPVYFEGLISGDSGVVPVDCLADGLVRGFKGQEFTNAGEQSELVANFEDVSH